MRIIVGWVLFLSTLFASLHIGAGDGNLLIKDDNCTLYWKGKYLIDYNEYNSTATFQRLLPNINKFYAKNNTFFAIDPNGVLYGWGYNYADMWAGLLGNGSHKVIQHPQKIVLNAPVVDVATDGYSHTLAVTRDGEVYAWGDSVHGDLGIENAEDSMAPQKIPSLHNIVDVAAGYMFSLAIDKDGNLYGWGTDYYGELGVGSSQDEKDTPVKNPYLSNVKQIVAKTWFAAALTQDGKVFMWGQNSGGVLTTENGYESIPVQIEGLDTIISIDSGDEYMIALDRDGNVYTWGKNAEGELGDGTTQSRRIPQKVSGLSDIIAIAAGSKTAFALAKDGTLYGWGDNSDHLISKENETIIATPTKIALPFTPCTSTKELPSKKVSIALHPGWNFVALPSKITIDPKMFFSNYILWIYRQGNWEVQSDMDEIDLMHKKYIYPGEGFWLYTEENQTKSFSMFDYDLNRTDAFKAASGWSMLGSGRDGNITELTFDGVRDPNARKVAWKYTSHGWQYYAFDRNVSEKLSSYTPFDGTIKRGEAFWLLNDTYLYDYRNFGSSWYPTINKEKNRIVVDGNTIIKVVDLYGNYIDTVHTINIGKSFRNYLLDNDYLLVTIDNAIWVYALQNEPKKIAEYTSNGYIWSMKRFGNQLWLQHDKSVEIVDISDPEHFVHFKDLPGTQYLRLQNYIVTVNKSEANIFDRYFIKQRSVSLTQIPQDVSSLEVFADGNDVIIGYYGYDNYNDDSTYHSGIIVIDSSDGNVTQKDFGDRDIIPFGIIDHKIYCETQNGHGGGLQIRDKELNLLKEYKMDTMVFSFRKFYITKNKNILARYSAQGAYYAQLFDSDLNSLGRVKLFSYLTDDVLPIYDDGNMLVLFPDRWADSAPTIFVFSTKDNTFTLLKRIPLQTTYNFYLPLKDDGTSVLIEGDRFEIVDFWKYLGVHP